MNEEKKQHTGKTLREHRALYEGNEQSLKDLQKEEREKIKRDWIDEVIEHPMFMPGIITVAFLLSCLILAWVIL